MIVHIHSIYSRMQNFFLKAFCFLELGLVERVISEGEMNTDVSIAARALPNLNLHNAAYVYTFTYSYII